MENQRIGRVSRAKGDSLLHRKNFETWTGWKKPKKYTGDIERGGCSCVEYLERSFFRPAISPEVSGERQTVSNMNVWRCIRLTLVSHAGAASDVTANNPPAGRRPQISMTSHVSVIRRMQMHTADRDFGVGWIQNEQTYKTCYVM